MRGPRSPKPLEANEIKALFLRELMGLLEGNTVTICQHMCCILRRKNNGGKDSYDWTDLELLNVIQNYRRELRDLDKEDRDENLLKSKP